MGAGRVLCAALIGMMALCSARARADAVEDFYKGRTVTVYIASGPGGGYDAYGRILAQYIVQHLPGHPQDVAENMSGAGGRTVANFLYNKAPKDGTAIGILQAPIIMDRLLYGNDAQGALYDPLKFSWIGSLDQFTPIAVVMNTLGVKTLDQAKGKEIKFGSSGGDVSERLYANILNTMLGTKFVAVPGYSGSSEIALAMDRGEIPAFVGWYWAGMKRTKPEWLEKNLITVLVQFGIAPNPEIKAPFILDLLKNADDKQVVRTAIAQLAMARPFTAPPGVPADRLAALRAAFDATVKDPAFLADAKKQQLDITPYSGAQIDALMKDIYATPPALVARVRAAMEAH
ncbi:MAG TPA: tripartite tricarboxylate transporter substrate-binding protein [Stellaceae bacterium]|jgi:tripartite-type tricarboxylate transporter receptor subunit TctC|nr:tripartite tricarboxylate transporter substrate-binding protein [Stellaceae bacterium]